MYVKYKGINQLMSLIICHRCWLIHCNEEIYSTLIDSFGILRFPPPQIGSIAESAFLPAKQIIFLHVYKLQGKIW